jgi:hypothetical protein
MQNSDVLFTESNDNLLLAGRFADDLAQVEPGPIQRADWVVYALKALEDYSTQVTYEEMLKRLSDAITNRLATGVW